MTTSASLRRFACNGLPSSLLYVKVNETWGLAFNWEVPMSFLLRAALLILVANELLLPARAAEELPVDKLEIQAKIPHSGDFMGFGPG